MTTTLSAQTRHLDELVGLAVSGRLRVPRFQRKLRWTAEDVVLLFDSIYRGFPIGTLLAWKRKAPAGMQAFGPFEVEVPATEDAWWLVDGQQRVTSLVAGLLHPNADPSDRRDPYVVYFDLEKQKFVSAPGVPRIADTLVPVNMLGNATAYQKWVFEWSTRTGLQQHVDVALELATKIRNYRVPIYLVENATEREVREIFHRVNRSGARMRAHEVFDALVGSRGAELDRIDDLAEHVAASGFGDIKPDLLQQCALALLGMDVTRKVDDQGRDDYENLHGVVGDLHTSLTLTIDFLVEDCGIAHARLLPSPGVPFITLTRFFHLFPDAGLNARRMLVRWVWRGLLSGKHQRDDRTYLRKCPKDVRGGAEESALRLLEYVPDEPSWKMREDKFDARSFVDRVALLVLASLDPIALDSNRTLAVADSLEHLGNQAIQRIVPQGVGSGSVANRVWSGGMSPSRVRRALLSASEDVLASHAISGVCVAHLRRRDYDAFLHERGVLIANAVRERGSGYAEWRHRSRKSLSMVSAHV